MSQAYVITECNTVAITHFESLFQKYKNGHMNLKVNKGTKNREKKI